MGGRASRSKGKRGEYGLRDYLRAKGFESHRVPSSGASQGFKGDVTAVKEGQTLLFEMKCRAAAFGAIYALWEHAKMARVGIHYADTGLDVIVSDDVLQVLDSNLPFINSDGFLPEYRRGLKKILTIRQFVKGCDVLCVKDDRLPLLFIRYF